MKSGTAEPHLYDSFTIPVPDRREAPPRVCHRFLRQSLSAPSTR